MYVPVNVINGKGKIVKIPPIARNSQAYYKLGSKVSSLQEIDAFLDRKAINNDVIITICDSGYLDIFRLFYRLNKMWQYSNFVAFVLDRKGYNVHLLSII